MTYEEATSVALELTLDTGRRHTTAWNGQTFEVIIAPTYHCLLHCQEEFEQLKKDERSRDL